MSEPLAVFVPPHCPRSNCRYHLSAVGWRWERHGTFSRRCEPRVIQRYRCLHCRATFSSQTFSTTYYLKRPELLVQIGHRLVACSGYRQIAREGRCAPSTVMGQAARLGRHALLVLNEHRPQGKITEPVVVDGFESFAFSQYHPLHLNVLVGSESHYTYAFTHSRLRRKGRMTNAQRRRRAEIEAQHGRPDPKAIEFDMRDVVRIAAPLPQALTIHSDEHPAYPRAFRRLARYRITHEQTSSLDFRGHNNPLFAVNVLDTQLRHNSANHKRETIAFSKRHASVIERAAWLIAWRNFCKHFSENKHDGTPAMRAGIAATSWSVARLLEGRRFATRMTLPESWRPYYVRRVDTPGIQNPRRHELKLAF